MEAGLAVRDDAISNAGGYGYGFLMPYDGATWHALGRIAALTSAQKWVATRLDAGHRIGNETDLDDWGLVSLNDNQRRGIVEILEDRYGDRATLITSQLPPGGWHTCLGESTVADAIMDRLVHGAYKIALKGPSRRKEEAETDDQK